MCLERTPKAKGKIPPDMEIAAELVRRTFSPDFPIHECTLTASGDIKFLKFSPLATT
jgi:hypothetical protein